MLSLDRMGQPSPGLFRTLSNLVHYGQQAVSIQKEFEGRSAFRKTQAVFEANKRSGRIKNAQLGTTENAVNIGIISENTPEPGGIYVGVEPDSGLPAFYKGSSPVNIKGPTRTGKSARLAMPIIISNGMGEKPESTFCIDIKAELFFATANGRKQLDGVAPIAVNPWNCFGLGTTRVNILSDLASRAARGLKVKDAAIQRARRVYGSDPDKSKGNNAWIGKAAIRLSSLLMTDHAECDPSSLNPGRMADFAAVSQSQFIKEMTRLTASPAGQGYAAEWANKFLERYGVAGDPDVARQFEYVMEEYAEMWEWAGKGSPLREFTSCNDVDLTLLAQRPQAVYLIVPPLYLEAFSKFITVMMDYFIDIFARAPGPVRINILADELPTLKKSEAIKTALRLYAGSGTNVRVIAISQDRDGLAHYGENGSKGYAVFEANSVNLFWGVSDAQHLKDIRTRIGERTAIVPGYNAGVNAGGLNISEQNVPVMSESEIARVNEGQAFLDIKGAPVFLMTLPLFTELDFARPYIVDLHKHPMPALSHE